MVGQFGDGLCSFGAVRPCGRGASAGDDPEVQGHRGAGVSRLRCRLRSPDALTNLAAIMANIGLANDGLVLVNEALRLRPDNPVQYYILANIYQQNREIRRAVSACETAMRLQPSFYPCRYSLLPRHALEEKDEPFRQVLKHVLPP